MFSKSARYYDAVYALKDYAAEAAQLHSLIQARKPGAATLLDVACGTAAHMAHLQTHYACTGLDIDPDLIALARLRCPQVTFHVDDMVIFDLEQQFDAVTCLFSAIGYLLTVERLEQAVACMARHLAPGGVLIVEPWLTREMYRVGSVHARFVDEPTLKLARMTQSQIDDQPSTPRSVMEMHYLVATPDGVERFTETHTLALYAPQDYLTAIERTGLRPEFLSEGLSGRGIYLGVRS
jgi:ubiquinone/menaquinone biosynthesis C-methylase UbiE